MWCVFDMPEYNTRMKRVEKTPVRGEISRTNERPSVRRMHEMKQYGGNLLNESEDKYLN
jgi:hypothetical protein